MAGRHHEVTRLEGFSDAVFGFALALLVVSLELPTSFDALKTQIEGFLGFALTFAMVCWIWYEHNWFFRHTGLQDPWTVFPNSVLLFVVLFYVYPFKFLTAALLGAWFGLGGTAAPELAAGNVLPILYSTGVVLIFGTFLLLYRHAGTVIGNILRAVSVFIAAIGYLGVTGGIYFLMGPLHGWNGHLSARAKERVVGA